MAGVHLPDVSARERGHVAVSVTSVDLPQSKEVEIPRAPRWAPAPRRRWRPLGMWRCAAQLLQQPAVLHADNVRHEVAQQLVEHEEHSADEPPPSARQLGPRLALLCITPTLVCTGVNPPPSLGGRQ